MNNDNNTFENQSTLFEIIENTEKENYIFPERIWGRDILFPVAETGAMFQSNDGEYYPSHGYKSLVNTDNGREISIVKNTYHAVENEKILNHFENLLSKQNIRFEYGFASTARGGRKTVMELILPDKKIYDKHGDSQEMRIYITNSFDGGNSINLQMGFFRHKCSNMAIVVGERDVNYKTSHIGDASDRIEKQFDIYIEKKFIETEQFISKLINHDYGQKYLENIIQDEDNNIVSDRDKIKILDLYESEYKNELGTSSWALYNTYTHFITHIKNIQQTAKIDRLLKLSSYFNDILKMKKQISF